MTNTDKKVIFCKKCVESNQRFLSSATHLDKKNEKKLRIDFSSDGICSACLYYERKKKIDWKEREKELVELLNKYRRNDGHYDVLIPGSGGKDSRFVSHVMKTKYKMNPLTCTWAPHMYTNIGWLNFQSWINNGVDNVLFTPNGQIHRKLTKLSFNSFDFVTQI